MGRPVFPNELNDPDFEWLLTNFRLSRPSTVIVEIPLLPVVILEERPLPQLNSSSSAEVWHGDDDASA